MDESNSEEPVSGVAQAWNNITFGIKVMVDRCREYGNGRMFLMNVFNSFRSRDQIDHAHMPCFAVLQQIQCGHCASASGEHWIDQDYFEVPQIHWQTFVIGRGL